MKKRIKIFAAFDKNVEEDVVRFGDFLCGLNTQSTDIEFSVFKSEKELCESMERLKKIDAELETYEYFLLVLGGKNDEFVPDKLTPRLCAFGIAVTETEKFIQIGQVNILRKVMK